MLIDQLGDLLDVVPGTEPLEQRRHDKRMIAGHTSRFPMILPSGFRNRAARRGVAAVEFALVAPLSSR